MKKDSTAAKPRPSRNDAQRQTILDAASLLFIEKGFGGTNFNDIADAVGVTRTALYYYFPSKETILEALTEDITEKAGKLAQTVSRRDQMPADEALRQLILRHAGLILSHPVQFRVVERSESDLPELRRAAAQNARRAVLDHFVAVIQRGIQSGLFRHTDAHVAAFSIIGMCNWCAWWFDDRGAMSADAVAASLADFALRALSAGEPLQAGGADPLQAAVDQIRDALGVLEKQIKPATRRASAAIGSSPK
ncbi:TetR/AcrR family transcriptional regulator [Variovorax sp. EL159]|uniref:TetR/AcrR family transcriptional regulator n=1 Tax=Variovorax sp. EL159 TaxID=1566270 RepID=UPI0008915A99|nr:TetR/AcrR family transcriptional regulator [Variovorax sp. EL159]SCX72536.1 transcriptional regulator, TetR family [Variovorax sp. EL159]